MINKPVKTNPPFHRNELFTAEANPLQANASHTNKESLEQTIMDSLDVQKLLHICRGTLYNWRKEGLIACSKVKGRIYYEAADVYRMLKERKQGKWRKAA